MVETLPDEDVALKKALYQSALEAMSSPQNSRLNPRNLSPEEQSIRNFIRLHQSNDLEPLLAPDADVLVVLGVPPQQPDQSDQSYASTVRHFSKHYRIHSKNIRSLGPTKFDQLLGPTSQYRTERRLKNQGILRGGKPPGIKYLLDLRPPSEGEEAIFLITQLSCTPGILTWFKAQGKYGISQTMVCGQDDSSLLPRHQEDPLMEAQKQYMLARKKPHPKQEEQAGSSSAPPPTENESRQSKESPPPRIGNWAGVMPTAPVTSSEPTHYEVYDPATGAEEIHNVSGGADPASPQPNSDTAIGPRPREKPEVQPEYSQLRHWSAIERLLHAIEGNDPILDSAPKVWTFFAIANYFGCATNERISGWIATWLFTSPNNNFIQCNPEVCYRIGLGIQSEALLKKAYSLLVGEKALINAHRGNPKVKSFNPNLSVALRKLEYLDDDEINRIDHAANVFIRRIQSTYDALVGKDMLWLERSRSFAVLARFTPYSSQEKAFAEQLKESIKSYVRSRISWVLARDYQDVWANREHAAKSGQPFYPDAVPLDSIYNDLSKEERIFTRLFWIALRNEEFEKGDFGAYTPQFTYTPGKMFVPYLGWNEIAKKLDKEMRIGMVSKKTLSAGVLFFDNILHGRRMDKGGKTGGDWIYNDPSDIGKPATASTDAACSQTQWLRTTLNNSGESDKPTEGSAVGQYHEDHLVPSPRLNAMDFLGLGDQKGADVDDHGTSGDGYSTIGKIFELPIRVATSQSEVKEVPLKEHIPKDSQPFVPAWPPTHGNLLTAAEAHWPSIEPNANVYLRGHSLEVTPLAGGIAGATSTAIDHMLMEITRAMQGMCEDTLFSAQFFRVGDEITPTNLTGTLTCLTDDEWQYLPLWAGGCDDGSGGVFADRDVPSDEIGGFVGGKRGLECGASGSLADSSGWSEVVSTVGKASKEATNGTATEVATVQSFEDVDMGVGSIDDEASVRDNDTVVDVDATSVWNNTIDSEDEYMELDDEDVYDDDLALDDKVAKEFGESGWDDCDM